MRETTIDLEDELSRIEEKREDLLDDLAGMAEANPLYEQKLQKGSTYDDCLDGLDWATGDPANDEDFPAWDENVETVTLRGLRTGGINKLKRELREAQETTDIDIESEVQVFQIRAGTVDAPFLDDDMELYEAVDAIRELPAGISAWLEWRIDDLSSVGNEERNNFAESLAMRRSE